MMNLHHLELFYYLAKFKGPANAARQMPYGITQPTVSMQVNQLEEYLGTPLYNRRRFALTPAGETLFAFAAPFFSRIDEVTEKIRGPLQIRLGASPILFKTHLRPVVEGLRSKFPEISMTLRALNQPDLIAALEQEQLDVAISLLPRQIATGIKVQRLLNLPLILWVPRRYQIKSANELFNKGQVKYPLICLGQTELICLSFQEKLQELGISWLPKMEMDSLDLIADYAQAGYGIGLSVRHPDMKIPPNVDVLDLPKFPPLTLAILYRQINAVTEPCRTLLREIQQHARRFVAVRSR